MSVTTYILYRTTLNKLLDLKLEWKQFSIKAGKSISESSDLSSSTGPQTLRQRTLLPLMKVIGGTERIALSLDKLKVGAEGWETPNQLVRSLKKGTSRRGTLFMVSLTGMEMTWETNLWVCCEGVSREA